MSVRALSNRVLSQLDDLEQIVANVHRVQAKAETSRDADYWSAVALELHGFYTGAEQIFRDIAAALDQSVPDGSNWQRDLLLQMSAAFGPSRPAVISHATRRRLDEYRSFRHVIRHLYTFNLRPERVRDLANDVEACFEDVRADLARFVEFLRSV